ncbi:hypothetical protein [Herbiconiux sp. L3-i23]|uniref:hypothetical protein n=1 Tax=Herbiconiux sp. L3-i23 TaxID=2905871 RepID=UPI00206FA59E|nr:hypothetical protein [Herbiconiux sp. L3-i23]BDI22580.1 hypothetical protein L3i23_13560 [Herbiconiux sp. L3-i23]
MTPNRKSTVLVIVATLAFALSTGCSAPPSDARATPPSEPSSEAAEDVGTSAADEAVDDVCSLLPVGDLVAITGRPYTRSTGAADDLGAAPLTGCLYQGESEELDSMLMLTVNVYPADAEAAFADWRDRFGTSESAPLAGLGDEAYAGTGDVAARFGDAVIGVVDFYHPEGVPAFTVDQLAAIVETVQQRR